ncbi:MAG: ABC transporter ATP-binding protein [Planctomycetota bacterium]
MSSESSDVARAGDVVLTARGVGKCYHMFASPSDRLRHTLLRRFVRSRHREFWALRGVEFTLRRGRAVGLIGRNGSGKSTLLQILAGTLPPTTGRVEIDGRVGALLELGSGFNPDFTGRENVLLLGVLLGLTKQQVVDRFDEIAAFAGIGSFLEQPVKTYSSGMFVRLAFAVQAVLSPEVLIVDEALAVGDAAFQIKCMTHMRRRMHEGMAVILASHDMESVRGLCSEVVWVHEGEVRQQGDPFAVTTAYLRFLFGGDTPPAFAPEQARRPAAPAAAAEGLPPLHGLKDRADLTRWGGSAATITGMRLVQVGHADDSMSFAQGGRLRLEFAFVANADLPADGLGMAFSIRNTKALQIITFATFEAGHRLPAVPRGETLRAAFEFDNVLAHGDYGLVLAVEQVRRGEREYHDYVENAAMLRVTSLVPSFSLVQPQVQCELQQVPTLAPR